MWLKIQRVSAYDFGNSGSNLTNVSTRRAGRHEW